MGKKISVLKLIPQTSSCLPPLLPKAKAVLIRAIVLRRYAFVLLNIKSAHSILILCLGRVPGTWNSFAASQASVTIMIIKSHASVSKYDNASGTREGVFSILCHFPIG